MNPRIIFALLSLLFAACVAPTQSNPALYGTVRVGIGPSLDGVWDWRQDQHDQIVAELATMSALGPQWVYSSEGDADVVIRAADLHGSCGAFSRGLRFVEVDATCVHSSLELQQAAAHELMHWWTWTQHGWLGHICQHVGDASDCHPSIWGLAVLNPTIGGVDPGPGFDEVYSPPIGDPTPGEYDLELFSRCQAGSCL